MRIHSLLLICLLLSGLLPIGLAPASAQSDDAAQILARINALRQQNGLLPLDLSGVLTAAAQRHSDDMARTGNIDHTGSDGSSIESRIREAGYGHWRGFGIWGENIYGGQMANVDAAWNFWINSSVHRANILKPRYREIGIGVGHSDNGTFYTLNFGSQPNVLPFFITGSAPAVTLLLTNENDITTGEGVAVMGQATQVRIAEGTDTSKAQWQPWAPTIPFQLSDAAGQKTITVEYKDELGRGSKASRTFNVSELAPAPPTPTETVEATATVAATPTTSDTATPIATTAPTATPVVTATLVGTATPTATATPVVTPTLVATATPLPTETATVSPTDTPSPTVMPTAGSIAMALSVESTITPTLTPAPSPTLKPTATFVLVANLPANFVASRLTPPAPLPAASERPLFNFADAPGLNTFAIVIGLQIIVLVMAGIIVVWRMRHPS